MSLFKVRDFWEARGADDEEFSGGSAICYQLIDGLDCLITGNLSGLLRVYHIEGLVEYRAEHLLIEQQLEQPILQMEFGKFVSTSSELVACILHPRKLAIVAIKVNALGGSSQLEATLEPLYEHKLERCSYVLVKGAFGGSKIHVGERIEKTKIIGWMGRSKRFLEKGKRSKKGQNENFICVDLLRGGELTYGRDRLECVAADLICVQSIDGVLSVFDRESHIFDRPLPGVLLPGPLAYIEQTDSFVTVTSTLVLETFRYQVLASATLDDNTQRGVRGKRVTNEWSFTLGEMISDLQVVQGQNEQLICALGEQTMFVLKTNAELVYIRRFHFSPRCFHVYQRDPADPFLWTMVVSQNNTVLVYEKTSLKWAAKVDDIPGVIGISRANLSFLK
ncbi:protein PTHB1-like, partial [Tropilaelaps mercedesae]